MSTYNLTVIQRLRLIFDNFTLILIGVVLLASALPAHGSGAIFFEWLTRFAIALLFFMHGAKLSREAIIAGAMHWRLHLLVFCFTFVIFPLIGWAMSPILLPLLGMPLLIGMVFLYALPGRGQSAIAFTSIARGNVPAAVCSASASSLIGIVLTPFILQLLLDADAGTTGMAESVVQISVQLLLPFMVGHFSRPWTADWINRNSSWLRWVDQSSILLVVYTAFSESVIGGLWAAVPPLSLLVLTIVCTVLLVIVLALSTFLSRRFNFSREDEIAIVFCGSKKSLATGVPMAQVIFSASAIGPALLPIMIFHQIQLMACAMMANRYALQFEAESGSATTDK